MTLVQEQKVTNQRNIRLAWFILLFSVALFVGTLLLETTNCQTLIDPTNPRPAVAYSYLNIPLSGLAFGLLGTLVIRSQPQNRIGWLMMLLCLSFVLVSALWSYSVCGIRGQEALPFGAELFWLANLFFTLIFVNLLLILMLFPDGRLVSKRLRLPALLLIVLMLTPAVLRQFIPGTFGEQTLITSVENPFGLDLLRQPGLGQQLELVSLSFAALLMGLAILSLAQRWRSSGPETRQQIKWFAFFTATAGALFFLVELIGVTVYPALFDGWFYFFDTTIFFIGFPLVIGLAVLKYRLYDIDLIIRRTLVYGVLTAILAGVYFGVVLMAQSAFVALTGQESPLAIVISTLIIAALFNPLRQRIQSFIDRRFYRRKYDADKILAQFAQLARDEVELEALTGSLTHSVQETMQPSFITLWLGPEAASLEQTQQR